MFVALDPLAETSLSLMQGEARQAGRRREALGNACHAPIQAYYPGSLFSSRGTGSKSGIPEINRILLRTQNDNDVRHDRRLLDASPSLELIQHKAREVNYLIMKYSYTPLSVTLKTI